MPSKWCPGHRAYHQKEAFGANSNAPDGLATYCREWANHIQREWKKKHAVTVKANRRKYIAEVKTRNLRRRYASPP
jgi:hypothetical protein